MPGRRTTSEHAATSSQNVGTRPGKEIFQQGFCLTAGACIHHERKLLIFHPASSMSFLPTTSHPNTADWPLPRELQGRGPRRSASGGRASSRATRRPGLERPPRPPKTTENGPLLRLLRSVALLLTEPHSDRAQRRSEALETGKNWVTVRDPTRSSGNETRRGLRP